MTHLLLAAALALTSSQRTRIDAVVGQVMREQRIAGLTLGIARAGTRFYLRGYGLRDVERRLPADGYTIYRSGSIAKQFTAALVLQAAERGRISLHDAIRAYLPQAGDTVHDGTVAQVLGQTTGAGWQYDNANYAMLGSALENVTGRTYPALLRDRITAPLGLTATGCEFAPAADNVAAGYAWNRTWTPAGRGSELPCSTGGLVTNAVDLLRWLDALRSGRVISASSFALMTTSGKLAGGATTNYGYGFFTANWYGYEIVEHPGYVAGYSAQDALVLRDGLEIAVLTNADAVDLTPLLKSVVAVLDPPRDRNLAAVAGSPPQNENPRVTSALAALLQTSGFASYGSVRSLEFLERSTARDVTSDTYRVTFSGGRWWATVAYGANDAIVSISLTPLR